PGRKPGAGWVDVDPERAEGDELRAVGLLRSKRLFDRQLVDPVQLGALGELAGELRLARVDLAPDLPAPGGEAVDPGAHRELPAPARFGGKARSPPVGAVVLH